MEFNAFPPSNEPGGLRNTNEIKILICYLLTSVQRPVSHEQFIFVFQDNALVNYFEFNRAISDLLESKHVILYKKTENEPFYITTRLGDSATKELSDDIPLSVKEKALKSLKQVLKRAKLAQENKVEIKKVNDGYLVCCKISDIGTDLLTFDLFVANEIEAQNIKEHFLNDPSVIYKGLLSMLTGDFTGFSHS